MRLAWALFLRPAPATKTPALTSSSMKRSIAANASGVGAAPLSLSSVVFANTITRIVCSPCLSPAAFGVSWIRRTSLLEIDIVLQTIVRRSNLRDEGFDDAHSGRRRYNPVETKARLAEKRVVFLRRALLSAWADQHHHIEHLAGMWRIGFREHHLDDEHAAARIHGPPAVPQDREAQILAPVVDDVRQQIYVRAGRHGFEEAARLDLHTIGQTACADQRRRVPHHMRQIEEDAARIRMALQDRGQQVSRRAAHIDERPDVGEIVGSRHRRWFGAMEANHRLAEERRILRVAAEVIEDWLAERLLEPALARLQRVHQLAESPEPPVAGDGQHRRARGARRVGLERLAEWRE